MLQKEEIVILSQESKIIDVLESMNSLGMPIAILINEKQRLAGIVTDGDIRRGFISGSSNRDPISSIMNRNPEIAFDTDENELISDKLNHKFQHIPILNKDQKIVGVFSNEEKVSILTCRVIKYVF
jgi:FOG: CBS domain